MELRLVRHGLVDSTSERAFEALARGTARHGDVHVASAQSAGRGRRGAAWYSPPGEGLYLSVVLLPAERGLRPEAPSLAGALAVRAALAGLGLADLDLKWPNDLLVRGAKLAGVLVESRGFDPERPHGVLGIGVNVRQRDFPPELTAARAVTSLALLGLETTPDRVAAALLRPLAIRLEQAERDPERLASEYLEASGLRGAEVVARTAGGERRGRLAGLSLAAGLLLEEPGGRSSALPLGHVHGLTRAAPTWPRPHPGDSPGAAR